MRLRHIVMGVVVVAVVLPLAAGGIFLARFDPNAYAPRLIAAVRAATGRTLTLGGPLKVELSLVPTITASAVSLANPAGYADPELVTIGRLEAKVALLPLLDHRVEVRNLVLESPQIVLEKNDAGIGDWMMAPVAADSGQTAPPAASGAASRGRFGVGVDKVEIKDGRLTYRRPGQPDQIVQIADFTATARDVHSPLTLALAASYNAQPFTLKGTTGPLERFTGVGYGPWPIDLTLSLGGAGGLGAAGGAGGAGVAVKGALDDLTKFTPVPDFQNLSLKARDLDLGALHPGLALAALDIEAPAPDQPVTLNARGSENGIALGLSGTLGAPLVLAGAEPGNFAVNLAATAGGASASVTGGIATPATLAGVALAVKANVPDLAALSSLAPSPLPALRNIQLAADVTDPGGVGLAHAVGTDDLQLALGDTPQDGTQLGGSVSVRFGPRPHISLDLNSSGIDADALLAAFPNPPPSSAPPGGGAPSSATPSSATPTVIARTPIPFARLKSADADIALAADKLVYGGATYTALQAQGQLRDGRLTIDPFSAELPSGAVRGSFTADAATDPARVTFALKSPGLALAPLLKLLGHPGLGEGTVQTSVDISGVGDTPHAIAATLNGEVGLAMVNGEISGAVLSQFLGGTLAVADLSGLIGNAPLPVRCFGFRLNAVDGVGTVAALTLDTSRLLIQGGGTVNFGTEQLGLVVRPQARIGNVAVPIPVQISGGFAAPHYGVAPGGMVQAAIAAAPGLTQSLAGGTGGSVLGGLAQVLGARAAPQDACPAALAAARGGAPGPMPAASATSGPTSGSTSGGTSGGALSPRNLLNSLFGK